MLLNVFAVIFGGALGSLARYLISEFFFKSGKFLVAGFSKFPIATFSVNVFGSFLAGVLYFFIIRNFEEFDQNLKNFLLVGFLGGFTTFSAFALDFFRLTIAGQHVQALFYVFASVMMSILALFFGFYLTKVIFS